KNDRYSELTALYWAWKHVDAEYIGLAHYRRHFGGKNYHHGKDRLKWVVTKAELGLMLDKYDVILPRKRRYYIETLYSHYEHTHYSNQLDRKSTRLNSSHVSISYAVFCLKKKRIN